MGTPPVEVIFPYSRRPHVRHLVIRNGARVGMIVNVTESSPALLELEKHSFFVLPGCNKRLCVRLHPNALPDALDDTGLKEHYLMIHCKVPKFNSRHLMEQNLDTFRSWMLSSRKPESDLVARLSITRSKTFCPLDTLIDLPGHAHFIGPVVNPTFDHDDLDCRTVHRIDSDTDTVFALSTTEIVESLKTNSVISTAHPFDLGTTTAKSDFSNSVFSWFAGILQLIFPTSATMPPPSFPKSLPPATVGASRSAGKMFEALPLIKLSEGQKKKHIEAVK